MRVLALICLLCCGCAVARVAVRVPLAIGTLGISELYLQKAEADRDLAAYGDQLVTAVHAGQITPADAALLYSLRAEGNKAAENARFQNLVGIWSLANKH